MCVYSYFDSAFCHFESKCQRVQRAEGLSEPKGVSKYCMICYKYIYIYIYIERERCINMCVYVFIYRERDSLYYMISYHIIVYYVILYYIIVCRAARSSCTFYMAVSTLFVIRASAETPSSTILGVTYLFRGRNKSFTQNRTV